MQKRVRQVFGWSYPNTHPTPRITLPRVLNPAWGGAVPTPQATPAFTFAPTCVAAIIRRRRASGTTLLKGRARARHSPAGDGRSPLDFLERCLRRGFGAPRFVRVASGQLVDSKNAQPRARVAAAQRSALDDTPRHRFESRNAVVVDASRFSQRPPAALPGTRAIWTNDTSWRRQRLPTPVNGVGQPSFAQNLRTASYCLRVSLSWWQRPPLPQGDF